MKPECSQCSWTVKRPRTSEERTFSSHSSSLIFFSAHICALGSVLLTPSPSSSPLLPPFLSPPPFYHLPLAPDILLLHWPLPSFFPTSSRSPGRSRAHDSLFHMETFLCWCEQHISPSWEKREEEKKKKKRWPTVSSDHLKITASVVRADVHVIRTYTVSIVKRRLRIDTNAIGWNKKKLSFTKV